MDQVCRFRLRINRYIVGCKLLAYYYFHCFHARINRYIVGCKSVFAAPAAVFAEELIDT